MSKNPNPQVRIKDLQLRNPVVLCSGTAGYGIEVKGLINAKRLGAIITKTITVSSREGNPPPRIAEVHGGILNSIGLENPGIEAFVSKCKDFKKLPTEVIVSIHAETKEEFSHMILELNKIKDIKAIELNLSCPNLKTEKMISQSPKLTHAVIKQARLLTSKVLIAKLSPEVTDIVEIASAAVSAGVDALGLTNTYFGTKIDLMTQRPFLGNKCGGVSGPVIKPLALYKVFKVYQALKVPIVASGGIMNYKDALEFILAGATCVGIGTATLIDPTSPASIAKDLLSYMKKNKIYSLDEIRGKAHE